MTKYDIDIMEVIWNNLTTKQKIDALQQAKNNICYTPNEMAVETWNVCTHYFKEKGLARAAHIEGGGVEAIQLTDLGLSLFDAIKQSQENNQSLNPKPQPEGAGLPYVLNTDEAKGLLERLCKAGYCDSVYKWVNGTAYQAAQAAYNIGAILWKGNKWKPFEIYWGFANMAQTFAKNRLEANQKDIDDIDGLYPENNPPEKDLIKL